jgi:hypothetical protein
MSVTADSSEPALKLLQSGSGDLINAEGFVVTEDGNAEITGNLSVTGTLDLTNPLPITEGGTGATTASQARINLGVAGTGDMLSTNNLSDVANVATARSNLGLANTAKTNEANTYLENQIISVVDNANAALRITQAGTGDALLVEDEANPDSTPFVIKNDGKVGIGVSVPSYPLDITLPEATSRIYSTQAGKGAMRLFSTTTGTMYVGKDYEGSSGWWGSGGEYVIAGTGNYPMDFHTNSVKRMTISSSGGVSFGSTGTAYGTTGQVLTSNGNAPPTWGAGLTVASTSEAQAGTNNTNVITPLRLREGFNATGSAPVYACRAWVNFDGTSNATNLTGTYSQTGTTVTVTITAHGYVTGNRAFLDFTSGTAVDGSYEVTVTDANTFTVTQASRTTSGNVTSVRSNIRASGNVSSVSDNAAGDYTVNFTNAMPDTNYVLTGSANNTISTNAAANIARTSTDAFTTNSARFKCVNSQAANTYFDTSEITIAFFR